MKSKKTDTEKLINLAESIVKILDVKCRKGNNEENKSWIGFQNGNGTECGKDIEKLIKQAKKILQK